MGNGLVKSTTDAGSADATHWADTSVFALPINRPIVGWVVR
jgi:hypothetical protein